MSYRNDPYDPKQAALAFNVNSARSPSDVYTWSVAGGKSVTAQSILRLIDPDGRPAVKLGASVQGAGLGLVGAADSTHVLLEAQGSESSLKLTNKEGRQRLIKP